MSNTQNTQDTQNTQTSKKVDMVTFVNFMVEFSKDGAEPITIIEEENTDGSINVDINDDFMTMFTTAFPEADLQETLQDMIETIVLDYINEEKEIDEAPKVSIVDENENIPLA